MEATDAIEVSSQKTGEVTAQIMKKSSVKIDLPKSIANIAIEQRISDIKSVLSGEGLSDPTMKQCSKCAKEGRPSYHPIDNFSTIKATGKLCSQCKKCKSVAATNWCKANGEKRSQYHKEYRLTHNITSSSAVKKLKAAQTPMTEEDYPEHIKGRKALETLYAAFHGNK